MAKVGPCARPRLLSSRRSSCQACSLSQERSPRPTSAFWPLASAPISTKRQCRAVLQPGLQVHASDPEIDVAVAREVPLLPLRQCVLPYLLQPAQRGRGPPWRLRSQEGLESLGEIPGCDALEVEPGQQGFKTFGA